MGDRMAGKPIVQAMVLADRIYKDESGRMIIAGTFTRLLAIRGVQQGQPHSVGQRQLMPYEDVGNPWLYLTISEVHKQAAFTLHVVRLADNQVCFEAQLEVTSSDPLVAVELALPLPKFPQAEEATFAIELLHEGEILSAIRMAVQVLKVGQQGR
jgi:hypothetical protein